MQYAHTSSTCPAPCHSDRIGSQSLFHIPRVRGLPLDQSVVAGKLGSGAKCTPEPRGGGANNPVCAHRDHLELKVIEPDDAIC